jgi:predicted restriction endonuclease
VANIYGTGNKGKATRLHALITRDYGRCMKCGHTDSLQCAHIISRKYGHTRTDLDNAFCLCASCHMYFTDNPVEFGQFTIDQIGEDNYQALIVKRRTTSKMDWDEEAERLLLIAQERGLI